MTGKRKGTTSHHLQALVEGNVVGKDGRNQGTEKGRSVVWERDQKSQILAGAFKLAEPTQLDK